MVDLADLILEHPFPDDRPLLHDACQSWTAGEARRAVVDGAAELQAAGVASGRPVAVQLTGVPALLAMAAVWHHGAVSVPVNDRLPPEAVEKLLADDEVAAIVGPDGIEVLGEGRPQDPDAAFVLWTSGTSGDPKPIIHHHAAYLEIIDRVLGPLSANRDTSKPPSPNLIPVPMALNAGVYNALFGLRAGAPIVMMDRFATTEFAELVRRFEIRSTVLPPAAITMLNDDEGIDDLGPLRYVRSITAPLSPFQARRFTDRFGALVLNGYGQAELGEVIGWTAADAKERPEMLGAAGRPHPGVEVRIDEPDRNGVGELLVKAPRPPEETVRETLGDRLGADGFVRTGDLARLDDGFVFIEGRLGDLINRGGNKVFPPEVEEVLASVPGVADVAVAGRPDDRLGEVPVAFVVGDVDDAALTDACRAALAPYKLPVRFERIDEIPRNDAGKTLRRELP